MEPCGMRQVMFAKAVFSLSYEMYCFQGKSQTNINCFLLFRSPLVLLIINNDQQYQMLSKDQ